MSPHLVVLTALLLLVCPSSALPTIITTHTTTSTDGTIPIGGTTLNVQAMLDDAMSNNRSEAVFEATRATFEGTLTISLPNTAVAWTTRNLPLRILIKDGTSGAAAPWPTTFIKVSGVLALGSNITIQGGSYDFATQFVNLPFGLTIQDGSTLAIEGGTFRAHYPTSGTDTSLVKCSGFSLTLANGGTLSISNYDMTVASVTASGTWYWVTLHVNNAAVAISGNSTLSISNAKVRVSDVTLGNTFWMMSLYASSAAITVSDGSSLSIESNEATIANIDVYTLYIFEMHAKYHPVTVHTNSLISLSHSATTVTNVKTKGYWCWNVYYPESSSGGTTIHTNSSIIITNSSNVATTVSVGDIWFWVSMNTQSPLTVTTNSSLSITNNIMKVFNVQSVNNLWWYALRVYSHSIDVITNSAINIANIHMEIADVNVRSSWYWIAMYMDNSPNAPASIRTSSNITISNVRMVAANVIVGSYINMFMLYSKTIRTSITSSSTIAISNNAMSVTNINAGAVNWHPLFNTDSAYTITTDSTFVLSKNTLTTATVLGRLTASEVSMSRSKTALGVFTATGGCNTNPCNGIGSGLYTCGGDGSSMNTLVFDCIAPPGARGGGSLGTTTASVRASSPPTVTTYAPSSPPTVTTYAPSSPPTATTYAPSTPPPLYESSESTGTTRISFEISSSVVTGIMCVCVGLVVMSIVFLCVFRRKRGGNRGGNNNRGRRGGGGGGNHDDDTDAYRNTDPYARDDSGSDHHHQQPVMGLPINMTKSINEMEPYEDGVCYIRKQKSAAPTPTTQ